MVLCKCNKDIGIKEKARYLKMKTTTQKQLKQYEQIESVSLHLGNHYNIDTGKHLYALTDKHVVAVSSGVYGVNGALIDFKDLHTNKTVQLAVIGRTPELFELL